MKQFLKKLVRGARVEAFDTRDVVEEQVKSLGAKFVKIDLGDTGQTDQGYAKELTPEQITKQKELQSLVCARSDIVITTAQIFGRPAQVNRKGALRLIFKTSSHFDNS